MTEKPRYAGHRGWGKLEDFSNDLRCRLRDFYPLTESADDRDLGHSADEFVERILAEASWAKSELHWARFEGTKAAMLVECQDLHKRLTALEERLRTISPDVDRLLGVQADPLGCADRLVELTSHVEAALCALDKLPRVNRADERQQRVAIEMAISVLRVLKQYGIKPAATGNCYFGYTSDAVQILKLIGDDINLFLHELTWRDHIIKAKASAPDLQ